LRLAILKTLSLALLFGAYFCQACLERLGPMQKSLAFLLPRVLKHPLWFVTFWI